LAKSALKSPLGDLDGQAAEDGFLVNRAEAFPFLGRPLDLVHLIVDRLKQVFQRDDLFQLVNVGLRIVLQILHFSLPVESSAPGLAGYSRLFSTREADKTHSIQPSRSLAERPIPLT